MSSLGLFRRPYVASMRHAARSRNASGAKRARSTYLSLDAFGAGAGRAGNSPQRSADARLELRLCARALLALSFAIRSSFVRRTLNAAHSIVNLATFSDRRFAIGCVLSFVLGVGLFGSVYLMPVFLAFVRDHNALEIGKVMLVTGVAQLLIAPVAVALEQRLDARLLTAPPGFGLFALGLGLSGLQTPQTDFDAMFWPQVIRGLAIMFCLLPPTRLALGHLDGNRVPDASGLFNLMRNLGGAIGLALIDTVIYTRSPRPRRCDLGAAASGRCRDCRIYRRSCRDVRSAPDGSA